MTVLDLIKGSLRLLGAIASGEPLAAEEATDALSALNAMLDSWSTERLLCYNVAHSTQDITAGTQEYTVGLTGTWAIARPSKVDRIVYDDDVIVPFSQQLDTTLITVQLDSEPTVAREVEVYYWTPLQKFTALTDELALPPGYERALRYNLAAELAAEYPNCPLSNVGAAIAIQSKAALKRINMPAPTMRCDEALLSYRPYDIYTGE